MQIIRFYSLTDILEPLAKFGLRADRTPEEVKSLCGDLVAGIHDAPDIIDFLNAKIIMLTEALRKEGYYQMPMIDKENTDAKCALTFDIVIDTNARAVKIFAFKVKPDDDEPGSFIKERVETFVLGAIIQ